MKDLATQFQSGRVIAFATFLLAFGPTLTFAQAAPDSVAAEQDEPIAEKVNDPTPPSHRYR